MYLSTCCCTNECESVIQAEFAQLRAVGLLPSCVVDTNEALRQRALRLITLGCSQKVLAAKMGMQAATLSRWLNQKGIGPISVSALDGFNRYVEELQAALIEASAPIRHTKVAGLDTPAAPAGGSSGTADGRPLATARPPDQGDPLPRVPRPRAQALAAFTKATEAIEAADTRKARRHAATARARAAGRAARAGKSHR